jgi:hypothetical protein
VLPGTLADCLRHRRILHLLTALGCLWLAPVARADESLQQVQKELRTRKYYFGPVDGRESPETRKAIEEFQRAKALDANGEADEETLKALGLKAAADMNSAESRALKLSREWLARYWKACESGDWAAEEPFYAEKVKYYSEGEVDRDYLRRQRLKYYELWPVRRQVALLCYATWNPQKLDELWVSARVRNEVKDRAGTPKVFTEELFFILAPGDGAFHLAEVREWPVETSKGLP